MLLPVLLNKNYRPVGRVYFCFIKPKTLPNGHSIIKNAQPAIIIAPVSPKLSSKGFIVIMVSMLQNEETIELTLITVPRSVDFMRS